MMASFSRKSSQKSSSRRSHSLIESPIVKRTQNQPVTLQSWLLKRGSEGLMLWKKRWCVLSDYCLFYYKDQSEEKLLGSLILASYEISACNPEEKGYKKFSFKAEHANMKTFYFAAENQLHMEEWMKALKCASLLEGNYSDDRKKSSDMRIFHQSSKIFDESQSTTNNDLLSGNQKTSEAQPVYVNAPPKPKRLNESSSPECSIEIQIRDDNYHTYQGQPYHIQPSLSGPQNFTMQPQHANYERRTPDIYGRASFVHPVTKPVNLNNLYIQDEQNMLSNFSKEQIISYTPKHSSINSHSRPHSVDFLEYHSKNGSSAVGSDIVEKPSIPYRPKSSLSAINANEEEGTHWSAEEYARKMRQSSMYVKPLSKASSPLRTETLLVNKSFVPKTTTYTSESPGIKHEVVMKSEKSSGSLYRSQHTLDNNEKTFFRSASARLFRAMSPVMPTNEFKLQTSDHKAHETPGSSRDSENPVSSLSPINKHHMRDKPLERLLLWKERMSQSPLQRKNADKITTDQHGSYISQKKKNSSSLSSNDSRNENCELHAVATSDLLPFCDGEPNALLKDISLQIEEDHLAAASPLSLCDYSPDHHGFEESESKQENLTLNLKNNNTLEKRVINSEINNTLLNEMKRMSIHSDTVETTSNNKINDSHEYSENKSCSSIKAKYIIFNKDCNYSRNNNTNTNEIDAHKKKFVPNSLVNEEFIKKGDKKQLGTKLSIVQTEKDEEWGMKLDESRVIKEFSYHYITAEHDEYSPVPNNVIHGNFKSRLRKPSSSQSKNVLQENLYSATMMPLLSSENTIQNDKNNDSSNNFSSNNVYHKKENSPWQKISNKSQKKFSKSGIINKGNSLRSYRKETSKSLSKEAVSSSVKFHDNFEKRQVQSDSEALLYDTSSDVEEKHIFHREHLEKPAISSDDERDEEVAAVLANEKSFIASDFESVNSQVITSPSLDGRDKTTLHSNNVSAVELGIIKKDLENNTCFQICHEKNLSTSTDVNSDIQEENYMPMTPRKKTSKNELVHSRSNSASHTLIIENLLSSTEESPYVEMTQNGPSSSCFTSNSFHQNSPNGINKCSYTTVSETPRYCEIGKNKDVQYEFIYNTSLSQEPVYMEVATLKEKRDHKTSFSMINEKNIDNLNFNQNSSKENINQNTVASRPSLPDILNTTTPSLNQGSGRSDSSDADDEASKDLDSLDAPRHPRFSLSDTFRPASYYLGGSLGERTIIAINSEHPDSSDSDLVSPPPIPASSPPLDDLDISIDSTTINKDSAHSVQLKNETTHDYSNEIFNEPTMKELRSSYKLKKIIRNSNTNLYEASSEESVDYEKREQRLKRRPLSADILNSLQDFNFIMPSPEVDILEDSENAKIKGIYGEENESIEPSNLFSLKIYKDEDKKYNNFFSTSRDDISIDIFDCESLNDFRFKDNRLNQTEFLYSSNFAESAQKNDGIKFSLMNPYENLRRPDSEIHDCNKILEKDSSLLDDAGKDKYSSTFNIVNAFSNPNAEHNTAPYYYSDLLKIDTKHFSDYEKGKWKEPPLNDVNENVTATCSNEKNVCYHSLSDCGLINNKNSTNEVYKDGYCMIDDSSNIEEPTKHAEMQFRSKTPNSFDSTCNINHIKTLHELQTRETSEVITPHRSRSLEGLLNDHDCSIKNQENHLFQKNSIVRLIKTQSHKNCLRNNWKCRENVNRLRSKSSNTPDIWEEDSLWRESLRKVSIRHTRSLEDLDRKDGPQSSMIPSHIDTEETCGNLNIPTNFDENSYPLAKDSPTIINIDFLKTDSKTKPDMTQSSFRKHELKRKITLDDNQINNNSETVKIREVGDGTNSSFEIDREKLRQWDLMSSAPAMLSSNRAVIKPITERNSLFTSSSLSGIDSRTGESAESIKENKKSEKPVSQTETNYVTHPEQEQGHGWNLKVSAGELLGRTHEELVLLLIQLRRQRATVCQSMEKCHREIEAQACLTDLDKANRVGHLQKLDELKARLADLEKQYEKGKPLVNLVDNMVKLGSLYQAGSPEKIEFSQRIQEQRLLAEEKRDWERIRPDHHELKAKVERLYRLDKLLQEESGTLHSLQQDKGVLERALGGLRTKLQGIHGNSPETEWYKRQQRLLEKELSRVRSILALNSKKLEETVAENARLEQELVVLRQKLQLSRRTAEPGGTNTAALEAELCQVQLLVGNLLRQRQELSLQVRQLTEKSNSLSRQIWPNSSDNIGDINNTGKKNLNNGWMETDLDAEITNDVSSSSYHNRNGRQHPVYVSPLYVNTTSERDIQCNSNSPYPDDFFETATFSSRNLELSRLSEMNDEEIMRQSYGFHLKEKPQEIKTVRIVKRESERRQRDRDRSGNIGIPISSASTKRLPIAEERCIDYALQS
ncbi:uncharacterized protein kmr isoform X2 [Halyomorpha halys]|uniref:uncharacterized protein kmr isoform X2 n=1 Tax=Halyomorpha halys TaxID=286706 RepID=UPI0006D4E09C